MNESEYKIMFETEKKNFWFVGRRIVFNSLLKGKRFNNILDFGCGTGGNLEVLKKYGKVMGYDNNELCKPFVLKNSGYIIIGDILKETTNYKFDLITAFDVLEHIEEDLEVMKKLNSMLNKGGSLLITIPHNPELWSHHDELLMHYRRYTKEELQFKLKEAGFEVEFINCYNLFIYPLLKVRAKLNPKQTSTKSTTGFIFNLLFPLYYVESWLIKRFNFNFGGSIICLAKK